MGSAVYDTGSGNWHCPAGVTEVTVEVWGPGGKGADSSGGSDWGAGGGGGGYSKSVLSVTHGNYYAYVVGAGDSGTASYFVDATTVLANAGSNASGHTIGNGGSATGAYGDTKYAGEDGAIGVATGDYSLGGNGGRSPDGAGGWLNTGGKGADVDESVQDEFPAEPGVAPGGGGGGGAMDNAYGYPWGASGGAGRVLITWADTGGSIVNHMDNLLRQMGA